MIVVTEMKVGNHKVSVPEGLSELLNDSWVKGKRNSVVNEEYDRVVEYKNGHFVTKLIKKVEVKQSVRSAV